MKIALYGRKDEVKNRKKRLFRYFQALGQDVWIDTYVEQKLLMENMLQYDCICLTEQSDDMITGTYSNQVMFEWGKKIRTCNVNEIYYAEAELKNVHIRFADKEIMVHLPFSRVEKILEVGDFIKVHRSYLVNCRYIQNMDEHLVTLKDGRVLPVSKYRSEDVHKQYAEYMRQVNMENESQ